MSTEILEQPVTVERLQRDLRQAAATLGRDEARYLVDAYYTVQDYRKASDNQMRALTASGEPVGIIAWYAEQMRVMEGEIQKVLGRWALAQPAGAWAQSITGIGPVLSAGLLAHIDIMQAPTAGHIWRFAGLDPTSHWDKGQKRPWNAGLKVLCWKIGESFVKVSGNEKDVYGKVYASRKAQEIERNERGDFARQAEAALTAKRIGKDTDAYKAYSTGKLPPAHIHARAKRYAVKLFLAHYHQVVYEVAFGVPPPKPYILTQPGHAHFIAPPNWPMT